MGFEIKIKMLTADQRVNMRNKFVGLNPGQDYSRGQKKLDCLIIFILLYFCSNS